MADAAGLHHEYLDTLRSRDFARMRELMHADYVYMSGDGVEQEGAEAGVAVAQLYTAAFPDLGFTVEHESSCGDTSVIEFRARGTQTGDLPGIPATGRTVELCVCNIIEVRDGLIHREREYYDSAAMLQQLGVLPSE